MNDVEAAVYECRRLLAALLGRADPPPGVFRTLVGGALIAGGLVAATVAHRVVPGW